jgi:hypothetical protein
MLACGGGGGGASITGELDRSGSSARANVIAAAEVDEIWALPMFGANPGSFTFQEKIVLPLEADGSFTFEVPENASYDYVLAVVDSSKCSNSTPRADWTEADIDERLGCIQGYVAVSDAVSGEAMIAIPTSQQSGDVDVGRLRGSGDQAVSMERTLEDISGSYSVDLDGLRAIAKVDNLLLGLSYFYANRDDSQSLYYSQNLNHDWVAPGGIASARDQFTTGAELEFAASVHFFEFNVDLGNLVSSLMSTSGYLSFTPPGDITLDGSATTYGPTNPIESTAPGTVDGGNWYGDVMGVELTGNSAFGGLGVLSEVPPVGEWLMSRDGVVVNKQDLMLAAPFVVDGGIVDETAPIVFVPSIRLNSQGDELVDIEVQFTQWNGSSFELVPFDVVIRTLGSAQVMVRGDDSGACPSQPEFGQAETGNNQVDVESDRLRFAPSQATYVFGAGSASSCGLSEVMVGVGISGATFQFNWTAQ